MGWRGEQTLLGANSRTHLHCSGHPTRKHLSTSLPLARRLGCVGELQQYPTCFLHYPD